MELLKKILDLPIIIQGVIGSFLFWLVFVIAQKLIDAVSKLFAQFNKRIEKENILFEQMHLLQHVLPIDQIAGMRIHIASIHTGIYLFIKGAIFLSFGLIASDLIGGISVVAYIFSLYYFFRALKACYVKVFSDGKSVEEQKKRLAELDERLKQINSEIKA